MTNGVWGGAREQLRPAARFQPVLTSAATKRRARPAMSGSNPAESRGSLFHKYVVYLVALVTTALIVSGLVGLYFTYDESKTARLNLQREKAEAAASRIESYIQEIERQLGWVRLPQVGPITSEQRRIA